MHMLELLKNKKILLVVAHPDDEILGAGATMHKLIKNYNCKVSLIILGEGITSRSTKRDPDLWEQELNIHKKNISAAMKIIGIEDIKTYNLPDNRFDSIDMLDIVKIIEKDKKAIRPQVIFTHHENDLNIDHQIVFKAVLTACRPLSKETVKTIFSFEVPSSTEWQSPLSGTPFIPNVYIEVNKSNLRAKQKAMSSYRFEFRKYPHPRSTEALEILAQFRGITIGTKYAEGFQLIRSF